MIETWKAIPGFPGYEASDHGRVRSLDRLVTHSDGVRTRRRGRILRPRGAEDGYLNLNIHGRWPMVHQLVLLAFVGPPPEGHEVAHGDGRRSNCRLSNLRYATHKENVADKIAHGTILSGERHGMAKLTSDQVADIRRSNEPRAAIAERHGINLATVFRIRSGITWRIPGKASGLRKRNKLSAEQAAEIRELSRSLSHRKIAQRFGVSRDTVDRLVSGKTKYVALVPG